MRLPFVSRDYALFLERSLAAERLAHMTALDAARVERSESTARYDALLDHFIALRRDGFGPAPVAPEAHTPAPLPIGVERALAEALRGQPADIQRNARQKARQRIADGAEPADVASEIEAGDVARVEGLP